MSHLGLIKAFSGRDDNPDSSDVRSKGFSARFEARDRVHAWTGGHKLCQAMLERAVLDLKNHTPDARTAFEWFHDESEEFLSFLWICFELGITPSRFLAGLDTRGFGVEPPAYPPKPNRGRQRGVGRGHWFVLDEHRKCSDCFTTFTAYKPDTKYCFSCQARRYPWKKRKAA